MKPTFYLPLCAAALACSLAVWAFMRGMEEPNNGHRYTIEITVTGHGQSWTNADGMEWTELEFTQKPMVKTPIRSLTDQPINPEAQRIIAELIETGMTPEEAALAYKRTTEAAHIERSTRPPMPGIRQSIDTNRFPLFEP